MDEPDSKLDAIDLGAIDLGALDDVKKQVRDLLERVPSAVRDTAVRELAARELAAREAAPHAPAATEAEATQQSAGPHAPTQQTTKPLPIDWSTEGRPAYANGLQVLHRPAEFALVFTDMAAFPGRLSPDGSAGNERAAVVSSLRITPDAFFQMLCVMASSWNRYVTSVVDPRMRQPRFKLIDAGEMQLDGVPPSPRD